MLKKIYTLVLVLLGAALGLLLGFLLYYNMFTFYLKTTSTQVKHDWLRMEYYVNKIADQTIKLRKKFIADKIKFDPEKFDAVLNARSVMIGSEKLADKAKALEELENAINGVIDIYNPMMELRRARFSYYEWGLITKEYIEEYNHYRNTYRDSVNEYNFRVISFPLSLIAKMEKYDTQPLINESKINAVQVATEKYQEAEASSEESPASSEHASH